MKVFCTLIVTTAIWWLGLHTHAHSYTPIHTHMNTHMDEHASTLNCLFRLPNPHGDTSRHSQRDAE